MKSVISLRIDGIRLALEHLDQINAALGGVGLSDLAGDDLKHLEDRLVMALEAYEKIAARERDS